MYNLFSDFALGVEFRNHRVYEDIYGEEESQAIFIGPTVNYQAESFYITFNIVAQVAGSPVTRDNLDLVHHEKYEFRTILGLEL